MTKETDSSVGTIKVVGELDEYRFSHTHSLSGSSVNRRPDFQEQLAREIVHTQRRRKRLYISNHWNIGGNVSHEKLCHTGHRLSRVAALNSVALSVVCQEVRGEEKDTLPRFRQILVD